MRIHLFCDVIILKDSYVVGVFSNKRCKNAWNIHSAESNLCVKVNNNVRFLFFDRAAGAEKKSLTFNHSSYSEQECAGNPREFTPVPLQ